MEGQGGRGSEHMGFGLSARFDRQGRSIPGGLDIGARTKFDLRRH
jgi:hypothetical protein